MLYGTCPQVLSKREDCYEPRCLPNFHILRDWGRKGFAKKSGAERICCFPGAEPQQDKLLTGDNRCGMHGHRGWQAGSVGSAAATAAA